MKNDINNFYHIKIFGKNSNKFITDITALIHENLIGLEKQCFEISHSNSKKYICINIKVTTNKKEIIENIYDVISNNPDVVMMI